MTLHSTTSNARTFERAHEASLLRGAERGSYGGDDGPAPASQPEHVARGAPLHHHALAAFVGAVSPALVLVLLLVLARRLRARQLWARQRHKRRPREQTGGCSSAGASDVSSSASQLLDPARASLEPLVGARAASPGVLSVGGGDGVSTMDSAGEAGEWVDRSEVPSWQQRVGEYREHLRPVTTALSGVLSGTSDESDDLETGLERCPRAGQVGQAAPGQAVQAQGAAESAAGLPVTAVCIVRYLGNCYSMLLLAHVFCTMHRLIGHNHLITIAGAFLPASWAAALGCRWRHHRPVPDHRRQSAEREPAPQLPRAQDT
jgi:hypothetical protein